MRISDWSSDVFSSDLILAIASRFGLDTLLARIGLRGGDGGEDTARNLPRRTRLAIEALGPTFVKLGQILCTRGDLLAPQRSEDRREGEECVRSADSGGGRIITSNNRRSLSALY